MPISPEFSHEEEPLNPILWSVEQTDLDNGDVVIELSIEGAADSPAHASEARLTLKKCLVNLHVQEKMSISDARLEDALLVFSELVGNAILHADCISDILAMYDAYRGELHLVVINPTSDPDLPTPDRRGNLPPDEHGRGVFITEVLTDGNISQDITEDGKWFVAHAILDGIPVEPPAF